MNPELARLVAELPVAVALFDRDARYVAASPAWIVAFGLPSGLVAGHRHDELSQAGGEALAEIQRRAAAGETIEDHPLAAGAALPRSIIAARPHRDSDGRIAGVVAALRGAPAAAQDPLTGLAPRDEFAARLRDAIGDPDPERRRVVVFAISLDNLRNLTNLHGAAIADDVLKVAAGRLAAGTRSRSLDDRNSAPRGTDLVARLTAEQFGVICRASAAEAEDLAARLLRIVQNPIVIAGLSLRLSASIGFVALGAEHRDDAAILRDLDLALQQAQAAGSGKAVAWEPSVTRSAMRRHSLAEALYRAFANGEFVVHYQPILQLSDSRMVGAEALLRWNHPSDGLVASATFVPVLDDTGLIVEVGCWVIREVVRQIESWNLLYGRHIVDWVSVNLSPRQLDDPAPLLTTLRAIYDEGFSVHRLRLETTEAALLRRPEASRAVLDELDRLGIGLALDDFGAGYTALEMLRHEAVDVLKIDARFVAQIGTVDGELRARSLVEQAQAREAAIIAEGIETPRQRDFLRASGCGFGQGYLFAGPMDGALLGAFALTHAESASATAAAVRPAKLAG